MSDCFGTQVLIGVSANEGPISYGPWSRDAAFVPSAYLDGLRDAGAVPVVLPPSAHSEAAVPFLDALMLIGGPDVNPSLYNEEPHPTTVPASKCHDASEIALLSAALEQDIPTFAICRGLQVLNVALGGSLTQHLPDVVGHDGHLARTDEFVRHDVAVLNPDTGMRKTCAVPSYHHQAIDRMARDLEAWAWAPDGTVEAACHTTATWVHGVQWHPEIGDELNLINRFVAAAREHRTKKLKGAR